MLVTGVKTVTVFPQTATRLRTISNTCKQHSLITITDNGYPTRYPNQAGFTPSGKIWLWIDSKSHAKSDNSNFRHCLTL